MTILEKIKELKEKTKKRKFTQRYDLIINLKDIDLKKSENKINEIFILPKGIGKQASITLFSDTTNEIKECKIIKGSEISNILLKLKSHNNICSIFHISGFQELVYLN